MRMKRLISGFGWGVAATVVMSILMLAGQAAKLAPMPAPIPLAIVKHIVEGGHPKPLLMLLALILHLLIGGAAGGVLASISSKVTIARGLMVGIFLWLIMELVILPFLGWGLFGFSVTPKIAAATLVLHLVYGFSLGWMMDRKLTRKEGSTYNGISSEH